jgi:hypothetical protein
LQSEPSSISDPRRRLGSSSPLFTYLKAWSARFSDDRSILPGPTSREGRLAAKLPSLVDFEQSLFPQFDFCLAGEKRSAMVLSLQMRAQECITSDLVSKPSSFSAQALLALELLVCCEPLLRAIGLLAGSYLFRSLQGGRRIARLVVAFFFSPSTVTFPPPSASVEGRSLTQSSL